MNEHETCIVCQKKLETLKSTPIDQRKYYIVGAGQLCESCYHHIYGD